MKKYLVSIVAVLFVLSFCMNSFATYSYQSFSVSEVLTAAKMNQISDNVRDHVHGADSVAELSAYARLADAETITGVWTFQGTVPQFRFMETGVTADNGRWQFSADGEALRFYTLNDADTLSTLWLEVNRTGIVVDGITLNSNVGIGASAATPDTTLHVYRGDSGASGLNSGMIIEDDDNVALQFLTPNTKTAYLYFGDPENNAQGKIYFNHNGGANEFAFSTDGGTNYYVKINSSGQLVSTLATGTAPLGVASTTVVANLNADTVDGSHASAFAAASHTQALSTISDVTITVANLNILDDGVDTTLHLHAADRARANHTGTQAPSTISPQGVASGLDADTVDGSHASAFATSGHTHDYTTTFVEGNYTAGNANGNVPISNGTVNTNLNADTVDGWHASGSATIGTVGGTIYASATEVGNLTGGGQDNLMSYTMPSNTLNTNTRTIRITAYGIFAANTNAKTVNLYFGGVVLTGQLTAQNGGGWKFIATVMRSGANTQVSSATMFLSSSTILGYDSLSITDSSSIIIKCTGQGDEANDIIQKAMIVELLN